MLFCRVPTRRPVLPLAAAIVRSIGVRSIGVRSIGVRSIGVCSLIACSIGAGAATIAPPFLDINAQCEAAHRKNVDAISECVVAESEARSEVLRKWDKVADADAATCLKSSRKSKRSPYVALAKCLPAAAMGTAPPAKP